MTINIPADLEQVIYRQLATGRFARAEDVLRAALANLNTLELLNSRDESAVANAPGGEVQSGKATVERLPEFVTTPDESLIPEAIPMPKGRIIQPVKGGKRLPEFHGIE